MFWFWARKSKNINPSKEKNVGTFEWVGLQPISYFPKNGVITARLLKKPTSYLGKQLRWGGHLFRVTGVSWKTGKLVALSVQDLGSTGR